MTDVLIIGAGPAGLTAAIYAGRAGMSSIVFDKAVYGGQIALTSEVDNYPGLQGIEGTEFAGKLYSHATDQGAQVVFEEVTGVSLAGDTKTVTTTGGVYEGRCVILANGAYRRKLGVPGEEEYLGRGVSFCATCDAAFFRGKQVAIVGGGDTALEDALYLANVCERVYLIHRRDAFRGEKVKQDAVKQKENIEILYSSTIKEILGGDKLEGAVVNTPGGERNLAVSGVFVAVGLIPETSLYADTLPMTAEGNIIAGEDCRTPLEGVFVAGDIRTKPLRQILTAAADGATAATAAAEYVAASPANCGVPADPPLGSQ